MKETGLMFKAPLVRAILSGSKTQTRRIAKTEITMGRDSLLAPHRRRKHADVYLLPERAKEAAALCPFGQPGDRIYVRETFVQGYKADPETGLLRQWDEDGNEVPMTTWYRATDSDIGWQDDDGWETNPPWRPSIHMPKSAARLWLEVTGVRVERLQSISRGDAMAEGCPFPNMTDGADPRQWFAEVWDSTTGRPSLPENKNSKRYARVKHWLETHPDTTGWAANPWVWVIDFKRIEKL